MSASFHNDFVAGISRRKLLVGTGVLGLAWWTHQALAQKQTADMILVNGSILTMDERMPRAEAIAIKDGLVLAVGSTREVMLLAGTETRVVELGERTVIPGINDSHTHLIRGGLHYNLELRWDGVPSLAIAMRMLRDQARRTPPPQWVQVVGGFSAHQFAEKRLPTLDEINAATGDTPAFILNVYDRAFLNRAALRAIGWAKDTPTPPGGEIQKDARGDPTGVVIARPGPRILLQTLALAPRLSFEDELNSTRQFMREYNRLGVTSIADAGGGFQRFPDDYRVIEALHRQGQLTLRIAYNLFTQERGRELDDFARWGAMRRQGEGDPLYRMNGAGENLVLSAADFENFVEPRPELGAVMESELEAAIRQVIDNGWSFRLHATYGGSIERFLNVFEQVDQGGRDLNRIGWVLDHAAPDRSSQSARWRHRGSASHELCRRRVRSEIWYRSSGANPAACPHHGSGRAANDRLGWDTGVRLQPLGHVLLARQRPLTWWASLGCAREQNAA